MKIGFLGLGNMGLPMARNLSGAGYDVVGYDVARAPSDLTCAASAQDAAAGADLVITMLPDGPILRDVSAQIYAVMAPGTVHLDCSTVDVDSARNVAELADSKGILPLDAPVSGGIGGATAGTLTFMVGGSHKAVEIARPALEVMGQRMVHCGTAGMGQAAKICNNMILGVTMSATCEAIALGDALGLDRQALFDVVSTSSGSSWSMTTYCPAPGIGPDSPADAGYAPGFAAELMLKDLRLAQLASERAGADTPMGAAARDLYHRFVENEGGKGKDFSAILTLFEASRKS